VRWLPRGTHQWDRFVTPNELEIALEAGGLRVLHKPFGNDELLAAVQVALQAPPAVNLQHC